MNENDFRYLAKTAVMNYLNDKYECNYVTKGQIYIVWQVKVLKNNKAMLSTDIEDGLYCEFTWNGDNEEGYLDVYKKSINIVIKNKE
jgi:hypothetical protein